MKTFQVVKDFDATENAGAGGIEGFQVIDLIDQNGNNVSNKIKDGIVFQNDEQLKDYLSITFNVLSGEIKIEDIS